jgi:hypothetical protein
MFCYVCNIKGHATRSCAVIAVETENTCVEILRAEILRTDNISPTNLNADIPRAEIQKADILRADILRADINRVEARLMSLKGRLTEGIVLNDNSTLKAEIIRIEARFNTLMNRLIHEDIDSRRILNIKLSCVDILREDILRAENLRAENVRVSTLLVALDNRLLTMNNQSSRADNIREEIIRAESHITALDNYQLTYEAKARLNENRRTERLSDVANNRSMSQYKSIDNRVVTSINKIDIFLKCVTTLCWYIIVGFAQHTFLIMWLNKNNQCVV